MECEELKDKLIEEIFSQEEAQVLIKKAKERIGRRKYRWLLNQVGPERKGMDAEVSEKGNYLLKIFKFERVIRTTENSLELPSVEQLEGIKKTRRFRDMSLIFSYLLAFIFFFVGVSSYRLSVKILFIFFSMPLILILHCKLFSLLEKMR